MNAAQLKVLHQVRVTLAEIADNGECDPETHGALELMRLRLGELPELGDDDDSGTFAAVEADDA